MAQTGYTPILIYASGTAGSTPSAANLTSDSNGAELALNYYDGKLFYKDNTGTVQLLAQKGSGTGTVTSVGQSFTGGLISVSGSPITSSGTLALTVAGTSGGVPYFSSASTWASSAALTANALMIGGGAGAAPSTVTTGTGVVTALGVNTGSAGAFVVNGGALGTPSSGTVTNLTGTASININGTVGATTQNTGYFTTMRLYGSSSGYVGFQGAAAAGSTTYTMPSADGTSGQVLATNGSGTLSWASAGGGGSFAGPRSTVYLTAGSFTFTIPSGISDLKITVVGGGGGAGYIACPCGSPTAGGTGGTTSVSSGTQTITTISATGGPGGATAGSSTGGLGSGGTINAYGQGASNYTQGYAVASLLTYTPFVNSLSGFTGVLGSGGYYRGTYSQYPGASGGMSTKWFTGLTAGNTLTVTVGAGGTSATAYTGGPGVVIIEY